MTDPVLAVDPAAPEALRLSLSEPRHLFVAPEMDPLAGRYGGLSGFDLIKAALRARPLRRAERLSLSILLPEAAAGPEIAAQIRESLRGYCVSRIAEDRRKLAELRQTTRRVLLSGGLFLAACLLLSSVFDKFAPFTPFLNRLFSESFVIAGWVAMWRPMELMLYEPWEHRREMQACKALLAARIEVASDRGEA